MPLTRRRFLTLFALIFPFFTGFGRISLADLPPAPENATTPSITVFTALCRILLNRPTYPVEKAAAFYPVFMAESWGPQHITAVYTRLHKTLNTNEKPPRLKDAMKGFSDGERWFAGHLLTTLYLGIYYHESSPPLRITRENAVMHDSAKNILPIPFTTSVGYGAWSKPPEAE